RQPLAQRNRRSRARVSTGPARTLRLLPLRQRGRRRRPAGSRPSRGAGGRGVPAGGAAPAPCAGILSARVRRRLQDRRTSMAKLHIHAALLLALFGTTLAAPALAATD